MSNMLFVKRSQPTEAQVLTGYVTQKGILRDEYRLYCGEALKDAELEVKFRNAEALTIRRDYAGAAALLEGVVTQAAVPAVYNNLGVLYAEMNDRGHVLMANWTPRTGLLRVHRGSGLLSVAIENRPTTLIPALTTFSPDRRNSGFGPDLRTPGASLSHRMEVEQNQKYFIQVWSQGNSSGAYGLTVGN